MQLSEPTGATPRRLARYDIHGEIAAGGMATVHLGRVHGDHGFARLVALKRLRPRYANVPSAISAFLDEAYLSTRVRHTNVVAVLDVVSEGDELWLAMEYVDGETLAHATRAAHHQGGRIPRPVLVAIVLDVLRGLDAMHSAVDERGRPLAIVHRDVSPQNVLVGTDGVARILDLGIATSRRSTSEGAAPGKLRGKLGYMAPEQARDGEQVTQATDLFGVGILLWEGLVGRRLFKGSGDPEAHLAQLSQGTPSVRSFVPGVPQALDAIVMRALEMEPEARFASAREMSRALTRAAAAATPEQVATWLREVAGDALAERAAWLGSAERMPSGDVLVDASTPMPPPPSIVERLASEASVAGETSTDRWMAALVRERRARRRNAVLGLVVTLALLLAIIAAIHLLPGR